MWFLTDGNNPNMELKKKKRKVLTNTRFRKHINDYGKDNL